MPATKTKEPDIKRRVRRMFARGEVAETGSDLHIKLDKLYTEVDKEIDDLTEQFLRGKKVLSRLRRKYKELSRIELVNSAGASSDSHEITALLTLSSYVIASDEELPEIDFSKFDNWIKANKLEYLFDVRSASQVSFWAGSLTYLAYWFIFDEAEPERSDWKLVNTIPDCYPELQWFVRYLMKRPLESRFDEEALVRASRLFGTLDEQGWHYSTRFVWAIIDRCLRHRR